MDTMVAGELHDDGEGKRRIGNVQLQWGTVQLRRVIRRVRFRHFPRNRNTVYRKTIFRPPRLKFLRGKSFASKVKNEDRPRESQKKWRKKSLGRRFPLFLVTGINRIENLFAMYLGLHVGAKQKSTGNFTVQGVALARGRREPVLRHDRNDGVDAWGDVLFAEIERRIGLEWLAEDHGRIDMGAFDHLTVKKKCSDRRVLRVLYSRTVPINQSINQ